MKIFSKNFRINVSILILVVLLCMTAFSLIWFLKTNDVKLFSLFGSIVAGLIVAIIQFIIAFQDYMQVEKLKELELIRVMYNRDDRAFYENYIGKAKREICVMGVTAIRLFNHFADYEPSASENAKVLLRKLALNINVRILLPNYESSKENKNNDFEKVKQHIENIKKQSPECKLKVKYFEHIPSHSIFIVDDTCIVGPVFPNVESKYTPALHLRNSSPLADKYITYFNDEWESAYG